jgi:hypothetical protein
LALSKSKKRNSRKVTGFLVRRSDSRFSAVIPARPSIDAEAVQTQSDHEPVART